MNTNDEDFVDGPKSLFGRRRHRSDTPDGPVSHLSETASLGSAGDVKKRHGSGPFSWSRRSSSVFEGIFTSHDNAKKFMTSIDSKNLVTKLDSIGDISFQDDIFGNTLFHAALEGCKANILMDVLEELFIRGASLDKENHEGHLPLHLAVTNNLTDVIKWMHNRDPRLVEHYHRQLGLTVFQYAIFEKSFLSIQALFDCKPALIDETNSSGLTPLHWYVSWLEFKCLNSDLYVMNQSEPLNKLESDEVLDFLIEHTKDLMTMGKYGSVLHSLVKLNYFNGIQALMEKLGSDLQAQILASKDKENKSPLMNALERSVEHYKAAKLLLDYGADPNEKLEIKYRIANQEEADTYRIKSIRTKSQTTIETLLSKANEREKTAEVLEKMLPLIKDKEQALEYILECALDDHTPSLKLLTIALLEADQANIDIKDFLQSPEQTAVHMVMKSASSNITRELKLLLKYGVDVLQPAKSEKYHDQLLPVHIAVSLQHTYDTKDDGYNEFGSGDYAKDRLKQYLQCLTEHGLHNLIKDEFQREKFVKYHLTPGVYSAHHQFTQALMSELYKLSLEDRNMVVHYKSTHPIYDQTALFWATRQTQQPILSDVVRAEFNVHVSKCEGKSRKSPGIECFEKLPNTFFKDQAIRLYLDLFDFEKVWYKNLGTALVQVLLFSYTLFALDIYFDVELIFAYQEQEDMINNQTISDLNSSDFKIASRISIGLIIASLVTYLILTWCFFEVPKALIWKNSQVFKCFLSLLNPVIYPFTYFIRQVRADTEPNSFGKSQRFEDCRSIWMTIRRVEVGVESTGQIIIQLWLLKSYFETMQAWTDLEFFEHIWRGLGFLLSFGHMEATFIEKMLAKLFLSGLVTCGAISLIRVTKPTNTGVTLPMSLVYFFGCLSQILARLMTLSLFFMIDMDKNYYLLFILLHVLLEFLIKVAFEWPPPSNQLEKTDKYLYVPLRAAISSSCGILVYLNVNREKVARLAENNDYKNTFWPLIAHLLLCLIEHIIVCVHPTQLNKSVIVIVTPFCLLIFTSLMNILYYKCYHPASVLNTNGPRFCPEEGVLCICSTLCCCRYCHRKLPKGRYQLVSKKNPDKNGLELVQPNGHASNGFAHDSTTSLA